MSAKIDTTVGNLVGMVSGGELRLPEMQRRYVWPATRVRDLLDSLYRGYPSGTILVWETDREMPSRDLAVAQEESPFKGHKLLLDGQQRLTSLSAILRGEPVVVRGRKKPIEILFNLDHPEGPPVEVTEVEDDAEEPDDNDTEAEEDEASGPNIQERLKQRTFVVSSKQLLADPHWVRVSDLFRVDASDGQILKALVKSLDDPNYEKYSKRLQAVRKIRDYPYVMHVLDKELSYEEVAEIFEPPRLLRRLPLLRGWSHGKTKQVPRGGSRASGPAGLRAAGGARIAVGGDQFDCRQDGLYGRDAEEVGAACGARRG